jgi:hypothetical protein
MPKVTYCFDTSAINRLHDEPDRTIIVKGLIATTVVRVTALNVIEVSGTADVARRTSLLGLLSDLADGVRPLSAPNVLLQTLAKAFADKNDRPVITLTEEEEGVWLALNNRDSHNEETRQEVFRWKQDLEKPFKESHMEARPEFQELFATGKASRPRVPSDLFRHYCEDDTFLYDVVSPLYAQSTGVELKRQELREFLAQIPQWPLYFLGWAYAIFERDIQQIGYGHKGKAGTVDLWCALYLPHCDCFVTDDVGQRKSLRILNVYNPRKPKTRVISYEDFKARLLLN